MPAHATVLITGAGNGLGAAMARGVAAAGHRVVLIDVDAAAIARIEAEIRAQRSGDVLGLQADITALADVERVHAHVRERFGNVDVLVNNAALSQGVIKRDFVVDPVRTWEIPVDVWRRILDVNVTGGFLMTRTVLPDMLGRGFGRIVNVSTNMDSMMRAGFAPYGGSKAAIEAGSASLAQEVAGTGVAVSVLIPGGPADTGMVPHSGFPDRTGLISPEVMAGPLIWICGADADLCNGRRFVAGRWLPGRAVHENISASSSPIGWPALAGSDRVAPMARA